MFPTIPTNSLHHFLVMANSKISVEKKSETVTLDVMRKIIHDCPEIPYEIGPLLSEHENILCNVVRCSTNVARISRRARGTHVITSDPYLMANSTIPVINDPRYVLDGYAIVCYIGSAPMDTPLVEVQDGTFMMHDYAKGYFTKVKLEI